jgi:hypothetical protein
MSACTDELDSIPDEQFESFNIFYVIDILREIEEGKIIKYIQLVEFTNIEQSIIRRYMEAAGYVKDASNLVFRKEQL